jgi:transaldolase
VTESVIDKLGLLGRDLGEYSLDTVKMFHKDAAAAGYKL